MSKLYSSKNDHFRLAFMRLRFEEFAVLWDRFLESGADIEDDAVVQVINSLPIETLLDWERACALNQKK